MLWLPDFPTMAIYTLLVVPMWGRWALAYILHLIIDFIALTDNIASIPIPHFILSTVYTHSQRGVMGRERTAYHTQILIHIREALTLMADFSHHKHILIYHFDQLITDMEVKLVPIPCSTPLDNLKLVVHDDGWKPVKECFFTLNSVCWDMDWLIVVGSVHDGVWHYP